MTVEILFGEVANLFGDMQNMEYLRETCPSAEFIGTRLTDEPWFVSHRPDLIYMGAMTENTQRRAIEGEQYGTVFSLVAADYLQFVPKKICD